MKVFALGGYGKTAIPAVKLLSQSDLVSQIAIAGRNLERAEKAAAEIGEKAIAVQVDGTDEQQLTSLLEGYDIVMNVAYNDTVLPTIRACAQTGNHYCDVAWGEVLVEALQLASQAKTAGITAIVATGISPCISNLMGVHLASQLDEVEQLQIGRADIMNFESGNELTPAQWLKDPIESLVVLQEFRSFIAWTLQRLQDNGSRTIRFFHKNQWMDKDPVRSGLVVPLPQGGTITSYPYLCAADFWGTLPRDLSAASSVEMAFSQFPPQLYKVLREQVFRVIEGEIDADTAVSTFYDAIESDPHHWLTITDEFIAPAKLWIAAVGSKSGRAARCRCWFTPSMWKVGGYFLTSVALAVAVLQVLRGDVLNRGVLEAENAFTPLTFLDEVAALLPELPPDEKMIDESFEWLA